MLLNTAGDDFPSVNLLILGMGNSQMIVFTKNRFRLAAGTFAVALLTTASGALAQSFVVPFPPALQFPEPGAFEAKETECFLFICTEKSAAEDDAAANATKIAE